MRNRTFHYFPVVIAIIVGAFSGIAKAASKVAETFSNSTTIALAEAITAGDATKIRDLVKAGANLSDKGKEGITLLQWAMFQDQPRLLPLLVELGADTTQPGLHGMTAVHTAAAAKQKSYLQVLLDAGGSPDVRDGRIQASALTEALMTGNRGGVALLLSHRANPNLADRQGDTPLHVAAQINDNESLLALLKAGADPSLRNRSGKTFAAYFAIGPKESIMSSDAKAARNAVRAWLASHGYPEIGR